MDRAHIDRRLTHLFADRRPTRWVTRERPKIDRIACPWLIRRFIDPDAEILYVPTPQVFAVAEAEGAVPFDIPGAELSHRGERCSFDAFIEDFALDAPALQALAPIVRGADTNAHGLAPEAAGLHAVSLGMAGLIDDDHALLERGMLVYDALFAWAGERPAPHAWAPAG